MFTALIILQDKIEKTELVPQTSSKFLYIEALNNSSKLPEWTRAKRINSEVKID